VNTFEFPAVLLYMLLKVSGNCWNHFLKAVRTVVTQF